LTCAGAAALAQAWGDWKASGLARFLADAEAGEAAATGFSQQKHHVDLEEFGGAANIERLNSCDYRL